jgi:hypothetical protein
VRGDSLRDLYAKTLALFGLALLAGVGALVDYWPTPAALPAVTSPGVRPVPAVLPAVASLDATILAATSVVTRARAGTLRAFTRREPSRPIPDVSVAMLPVVALTSDIPVSGGVSLGDPPPPPVVAPVVAATRIPASEIALPPAPVTTIGPGPSSGALDGTSADGFLGNATSACKKTGESIVNTTVKTGSSILKAFGVVGGAFKKVI